MSLVPSIEKMDKICSVFIINSPIQQNERIILLYPKKIPDK